MRLRSVWTGGARRRYRFHAAEHARLVYRGRHGADWMWEAEADDGRTYAIGLTLDDVMRLAADLDRIRSVDRVTVGATPAAPTSTVPADAPGLFDA